MSSKDDFSLIYFYIGNQIGITNWWSSFMEKAKVNLEKLIGLWRGQSGDISLFLKPSMVRFIFEHGTKN